MPRDQLAPFWETLIPRGFLGWGKSTQLGSSLGFAMGAKLAAPDKLVVPLPRRRGCRSRGDASQYVTSAFTGRNMQDTRV
jgi:hypothetical protein